MIEHPFLIPNHSKFIYKDIMYEIYGFVKNKNNEIYVKCYNCKYEDSVGKCEFFKLNENLLMYVNNIQTDLKNDLETKTDYYGSYFEHVDSNFLNDKYKELKSVNEKNYLLNKDKIKNFRIDKESFKSYLYYKSNCLIEFKQNIDFKLKVLYSKIYKEFPTGVKTIIKRNNILFHSLVIIKKDNDNFIVEYTIEKEVLNDFDLFPHIGLYLSELFNDFDKIKKELEEIEKILSTL